MTSIKPAPGKPKQPGRAVDDEDPDVSPMDGLATEDGPAQPMDVEEVESDRARSAGRPPLPGKPAAD
jgi:hypothetical protein